MRKFNQGEAIAALELHQLVAEWGHELDSNSGLNITEYYTEDCDYLLAGQVHHGHAAVRKFYQDRAERVRVQQTDGVRTQRHTITNLRITFQDADHATLNFLITNYSGPGKPPVRNLVGPTVVADCRFECRREADGLWRIALFDSAALFVGNDPFLNAAVVRP